MTERPHPLHRARAAAPHGSKYITKEGVERLRKELNERLTAAGVNAEWADIVVHDLERVEQIAVEQDGKHFLLRPQAPGCAGAVFQAVGVALPPMLRQLAPRAQLPAARSVASRRRGRPRRGATSA